MGQSIFKSFIKNPAHTDYQGRDPDEVVQVLLRKSLFYIFPRFLMAVFLFVLPMFLLPFLAGITISNIRVFDELTLFVFSLFLYLFAFGFSFQIFLDWFFEVLLITNKKIVDIDHSCRNISETPIENVQDITSKINGNIGEILNIGRIVIQTAAENVEFEFNMVDNPSVVRDTISDLVTKERQHGHTK